LPKAAANVLILRFAPGAQATPSDLHHELQLAVYFYRWCVTYLGRWTSRRQLFIGQQKRLISRVADKFKCTAVSLGTGDIFHVLSVVHVVVLTLCVLYTGFWRFREIY